MPHLEKIKAAIANPLSKNDIGLLNKILAAYEVWIKKSAALKTEGVERIKDMTLLLNEYKDYVEVDLIMEKGSEFLKRQKGQLKLDNSIMEEFLTMLMNEKTIPELKGVDYVSGPQQAFMSLAFIPRDFAELSEKPVVALKTKDQDFTLGKELYYQFSTDESFKKEKTLSGKLMLAILAAECKINLDKTMFQEAAGTASRLKQGVPYSKYYMLVEFLDMQPEDTRLTDIDNVFLLRHAKRLPFEKRRSVEWIKKQRKEHPIDYKVILRFLEEIRQFLQSKWYDPDSALDRGSFVE
ncbi:MAG: Restriction endonuclease, type II, Bpu10I [Candidatus Jorgensenbacteria bacterium GW2011_GWA1_48_11]|uniref:Restriction endonuclease, type II, Bpu10I n=1 Tax=Candidatus Jorgensenbacteria bacterium GW2011_GWA1_48_11 TaxID=1618660 RepID=A0A0G1UA45_9BACT|nr:MAG: Restriction endonuclease, type II, Bpu10I [Candidatus Jorgensenbacteria bacterium GW2011_GWA1_48_11]KKW11818.1 MAG: Restriction endonuclease, type II, Bpu10I [Candidatus Jorgensenbacteria bacterium GW2011_GWB1_49_9]